MSVYTISILHIKNALKSVTNEKSFIAGINSPSLY